MTATLPIPCYICRRSTDDVTLYIVMFPRDAAGPVTFRRNLCDACRDELIRNGRLLNDGRTIDRVARRSTIETLRAMYGERYDRFSPRGQDLLIGDVIDLRTELDTTTDVAVRELDRRIGNALESYVATLIAGDDRRSR
jgi:hypothetical protein